MICIRNLSQLPRNRYVSQILRGVATFNTATKIAQRNRAAKLPDPEQFDFLKERIAENLTDRITDISRDFPSIVDLGAGKGHVYKHLNTYTTKHVIECDTASQCLALPRKHVEGLTTEQLLLNSEDELPFEDNSQDMIVSNLWLHWVNDLPKLFTEAERVLIPDGVFLGAMFGSETVFQLRVSLQQAELERTGGISPHISPFITPQDLGALLHSAGFCMITLDSEEITIGYPDLHVLLQDLQGMGESGALTQQPHMVRRDVLTAASAIYHTLYAEEDHTLPLSFNVLFFIGWKKSKFQGVPVPRGSQIASIADLGKIIDKSSDDK